MTNNGDLVVIKSENDISPSLVGGLEHGFNDFPDYWECHHPN
jgi:hypothetical protein